MLRGKKILVVDKAESIRHFIRHILASIGYRVFLASNARQALALADEYSFDAVLADINMPDMDGIMLIKALRHYEGYESIPILVVTMSNSVTIKQQGKKAGASGWIPKPVSASAVVEMLSRLLRNAALQAAHQSG